MMKPVEEMFALCRALKAAGFELQADRIIRAADAFERLVPYGCSGVVDGESCGI
jgi:hypothetical protein